MKFESLKANSLMGCTYSLDFDPRYTIIIGNNRQGKTLTARLIMLALYGTGTREKDLHESWKLRPDELLSPSTQKGSVELVLEKNKQRYKILREFGVKNRVEMFKEQGGGWGAPIAKKDNDVKSILEDDIGITPGLMNVVMSNEQSLIGAISYDEKLQASVWEGWKWRTEIIKDNIKRARDTCGRHAKDLMGDIDGLKESIGEFAQQWAQANIFTKEEVEEGIDAQKLHSKDESIKTELKKYEDQVRTYSGLHQKMLSLDDIDDKETVEKLNEALLQFKDKIDEKEKAVKLNEAGKEHLAALSKVMEKGGRDGISQSLNANDDETKKLQGAVALTHRKKEPLKAECLVFPPEDNERLCIQIPDTISNHFKYEELAGAGVAVPYDKQRLDHLKAARKELEELLTNADTQRKTFKDLRDSLRLSIGTKKEELATIKGSVEKQQTTLETTKANYLKDFKEKVEKEFLLKKLEAAKTIFSRIHDTLSEEESLSIIRQKTVQFINRIFESHYSWDINAKLTEDEKIMITDSRGVIRSHPSGSETHIMGLAWRWMVARAFDLPLVLDELDILLDDKNYDRTRKLIEEEMDRQTVILTLRETLKDLPGKIYKMNREEGLSTVSEADE